MEAQFIAKRVIVNSLAFLFLSPFGVAGGNVGIIDIQGCSRSSKATQILSPCILKMVDFDHIKITAIFMSPFLPF